MPIATTVDEDTHRISAVATGIMSAAELFTFESAYRIGQYRRYRVLFDARDAGPETTWQDISSLAQALADDAREMGPPGAMAIVATGATLDRARHFEALCHSAGLRAIRVFDQVEPARRWLDAIR
jgi:hypothetical protein